MQHYPKRTGPRPLWLHLNAGAAMMAATSEGEEMFSASQGMLQKAMDGVKSYHDSPVKPFCRDMDNVAESDGTRLLSCKKWTSKKCVILIPSLINSWRIFDIEDNHSFAAYLNDHGMKPLIVDWAEPDTNIPLNDYITHHLKPLVEHVIAQGYEVTGLIGYCMGATFVPALYTIFSEVLKQIKCNILIAPPWGFAYQSIEQSTRLQTLAMQTYAMGDLAPTDFVQSLFWAVDPLQVFKKFQKFPDVKNPDRFVRVEDWLNEGRAVSKSVLQTCLFDWYRDNKITKGEWRMNAAPVSMQALPDNTLVIAGENDNLVPMASVQPLLDRYHHIIVNTGHIGLMASDKSVNQAWKSIVEFLKERTIS